MLIQTGHMAESAETVCVTLSERDMDRVGDRVGGGLFRPIIPIPRPMPIYCLIRRLIR